MHLCVPVSRLSLRDSRHQIPIGAGHTEPAVGASPGCSIHPSCQVLEWVRCLWTWVLGLSICLWAWSQGVAGSTCRQRARDKPTCRKAAAGPETGWGGEAALQNHRWVLQRGLPHQPPGFLSFGYRHCSQSGAGGDFSHLLVTSSWHELLFF